MFVLTNEREVTSSEFLTVVRQPFLFKRLLVCLTALFQLAGITSGDLIAAQQPQISIPTVITDPGDTYSAIVRYSPQTAHASAIQFDLAYNRTVFKITASAGNAVSAVSKNMSTVVLPNGAIRFLIFGLNQDVITGGDLVNLQIKVSAKATLRRYILAFSNVRASGPAGRSISIGSTPGKIVLSSTAP